MGAGMDAKMKRSLFKFSVDLFEELVAKVTKRPNFKYRCSDQDLKSWEAFVDHYRGRVLTEDFLTKYIEYGIQSWFNKGSEEDYSRRVRFSWVIGKQAIKRWDVFGEETNVRITRGHIKKIYKKELGVGKARTSLGKVITEVNPTEEVQKARFAGTSKRLAWCIAMTTLYNHKSTNCATCDFKAECKIILEKEYPKVYKRRGYGK